MPFYLIIAGIIFLLARRKQATNATTTNTIVLPLGDKPVNVDNAAAPWSHLIFVNQFLATPDGSAMPVAKPSSTPSGNPNALTAGLSV